MEPARQGGGAALRSGLGASLRQKPFVSVAPPPRKTALTLAEPDSKETPVARDSAGAPVTTTLSLNSTKR